MSYEVAFRPSARKELADVPASDRRRIVTRLEAYAAEPAQPGHAVIRLSGTEELYRLRVGVWRVLFMIEDDILRVRRVVHRREAYR